MADDVLPRYGVATQGLAFTTDVAAYAQRLNDSIKEAADDMAILPDPAEFLVLLQQYADASGNDE